MQQHTAYIITFSLVVFVIITLVVFINIMVDPLWYNSGNKITNKNFAFNERFSKTNLFLQERLKYDCVIFGSSRTTLLDATRIQGSTCFNFAFSGGTVREFIKFADYIQKYARTIKKVIVGVDGFNFYRSQSLDRLPIFITEMELPANILKSYLSFDSLIFSIRTLLNDSPHFRFYNSQFKGLLLHRATSYSPPKCINSIKTTLAFKVGNIQYYEKLNAIFNQAELIAYVPPISVWDMLPLYLSGDLDHYMQAIFATSRLFDRFYDFSVPSVITSNPKNTFDGDHFSIAINDIIAQTLNTDKVEFGIALHNMKFLDYKRLYERNFELQIEILSIRQQPRYSCKSKSAFW